MGVYVGDDDEVDDEEGGVEHEVGAADQHRAGPHTQLQTRDHGHPKIISLLNLKIISS